MGLPPQARKGYPPGGGNFPEIPQNYPILGGYPPFPQKGGPKKGPKSKGDLGSLVQNTKFWMRRFTPPPGESNHDCLGGGYFGKSEYTKMVFGPPKTPILDPPKRVIFDPFLTLPGGGPFGPKLGVLAQNQGYPPCSGGYPPYPAPQAQVRRYPQWRVCRPCWVGTVASSATIWVHASGKDHLSLICKYAHLRRESVTSGVYLTHSINSSFILYSIISYT